VLVEVRGVERLGIEEVAHPVAVFTVPRFRAVGSDLEVFRVPERLAAILGLSAAAPVDARKVTPVGFGGEPLLDEDILSPVVAEVVAVEEPAVLAGHPREANPSIGHPRSVSQSSAMSGIA